MSVARDDRLLPFTRILGAVILPFLVVAAVLLLGLPGETEVHFAWTILPPLTATLLGSAYAGGIWFFIQVVRQRIWHRVAWGFPAVVVFATLLGAATALHWDRFHPGHPSFLTWATLYALTPPLTLLALVLNVRHDPRSPERDDVEIPAGWRIGLALVGAVAAITGLVLFVAPALLIGTWGWDVTPLTARVVGAVLTLPGFVNVWMLRDRRWSSFRWLFQAQLVSLAAMLFGLVIRGADVAWDRPAAWAFVIGIVASAGVYGLFVGLMEERRRAAG
ncbi:hypothetical protein [Agromyces aerolatus]|uniref:hypothetical protein n=1 Tax=Agromyces sp. LY-1074 TaxID=3074080 RepID=UPI0028580ED3|nr:MULTISPECIES: hypothetical protein [unclassified Agromyces]MDR5698221.1 hypothetical protein [Agromyces sp. LY-1074]MDR5704515.1 hypothetical protein [Agromyces sp. LY-1358]